MGKHASSKGSEEGGCCSHQQVLSHKASYKQTCNCSVAMATLLLLCNVVGAIGIGAGPHLEEVAGEYLVHRGDFSKTRGDSHSLMQVNAPAVDMVMLYIRQAVNHYGPVTLTVWYHPPMNLGLLGWDFRQVVFNQQLEAGAFARSVWGDRLDRRQAYVFPIKPIPSSGPTVVPHLLVTTMRGDEYIPAVIDYFGHAARYRASFIFHFGNLTFPAVQEFFNQAVQGHGCPWEATCTIKIQSATGVRTYTWQQRVPVHEGIHLHLLETALDTDTEDDETVCGSSLATLSLVDSEDEISEAEAEGSTEQSLESGTDEENC